MTKEIKLFLGPQHPGMHGNSSIHMYLEGDIVKKSLLMPGFLHRGFEKGMENRTWINNIALIPRVCVVEPDINEMCFAQGVEMLSGIEVPDRAKWIRMIILELARMSIHLMAAGGLGSPTGNYTTIYITQIERNKILNLFEKITGHRIYHQYIVPGGVRRDISDQVLQDVLDTMDSIEDELQTITDLILNNPTMLLRITDNIMLPDHVAWELGVTGIGLRTSANKAYDVRKVVPYANYDKVDFEVPISDYSDAYNRVKAKFIEITQSISIIRQSIEKMEKGPVRAPLGANALKFRVPKGQVYSTVESSRGEYGYYMVSDGDIKPYRVHVRGASFPQGTLGIEKYLPGTRLEDAALWVDTMGICSPEIDR
jgi:NADH-quinone oxidoreductase subunit D